MIIIAPSSPPLGLGVLQYTANTISLQWVPPPEHDINGLIKKYVLRYSIEEQLGVVIAPQETVEKNR